MKQLSLDRASLFDSTWLIEHRIHAKAVNNTLVSLSVPFPLSLTPCLCPPHHKPKPAGNPPCVWRETQSETCRPPRSLPKAVLDLLLLAGGDYFVGRCLPSGLHLPLRMLC